MEWHARRTFDSTDRAPSEARRFVRECLHAWRLNELNARIMLAVSELTTNAVVHGSGPIDVALVATSDRLRVTVTDHGSGTPALDSPGSRNGELGGWGLQLVNALADNWGSNHQHGRTIVWFEHALSLG